MRRGTELDGIPEPGKTETGRYLYQGAAPMRRVSMPSRSGDQGDGHPVLFGFAPAQWRMTPMDDLKLSNMATAAEFENGVPEAHQYMIGTPGVDARFVVNADEYRRVYAAWVRMLGLAVAASGGQIRIPRSLAIKADVLLLSDEFLTDEWVLTVREDDTHG